MFPPKTSSSRLWMKKPERTVGKSRPSFSRLGWMHSNKKKRLKNILCQNIYLERGQMYCIMKTTQTFLLSCQNSLWWMYQCGWIKFICKRILIILFCSEQCLQHVLEQIVLRICHNVMKGDVIKGWSRTSWYTCNPRSQKKGTEVTQCLVMSQIVFHTRNGI